MDESTNNPPSPARPAVPPPPFKPNIYPIMYWALAFGAAAGVLLFVLFLLSQVIGLAWFPVFLSGLIWGGFRNYQKQKRAWAATTGVTPAVGSPLDEFRQAARDITTASRDLLEQESPPPADGTQQPPAPPTTTPPT